MNTNLEKKLDSINNIPTLPSLASQLLELLGSVNVSMTKISKIMEVDPSMTAKVLKTVNSAYYGLRKKVDTLRMAFVILGLNEVSDIVLGLSVVQTFSTKTNTEFDLKRFLEHSAITANISKKLTKLFRIPTHGEEFTAGILHNIGKTIIHQYLEEDSKKIIDLVKNHGLSELEAERIILDSDHCEIGSWLGKKWKLPTGIIQTIEYHHHPEAFPTNLLVPIVNIADSYANEFGYKQDYINSEFKTEELESWIFLEKFTGEINFEELKEKLEPEVEASVNFINSLF